MKTVRGWINIYRSGYYHRLAKPGQYDRHPGDIYPTEEAAKRDIDPDAAHLYIDTTAVVWIDPEDKLEANSIHAEPVPLSVTKRIMRNPGYTAIELVTAVVKWAMGESIKRDPPPETLEKRIPSHIEGMRPLVKSEPLMPLGWQPMDFTKSDWSLEPCECYSERFDAIAEAEQAALGGAAR